MAQSKETRALQHLLLQGFTLYTSEAADALRARGPSSLDDPAHAYAVVLGSGMVQCCWGGAQLLVPLATDDVRDARLKLETAVTLRLAPPVEKLEAFPDELIQREAKRRGLLRVEPTAVEPRAEDS